MTPARGLSFFCDFPALPTCPISRPTSPSLPAVSILGFPTPRPFSPTNAQHAPHPNTLSSHPIFPHKKPGRFFPQASFPSLHTQQFPSLQPPLFPSPPPPAALPSEPAPFPPAPFSSSHFPTQKARRHPCLRANISHVCPSLGTSFFRCRAAPYSLKSSSVNWEVRRGGATRGSRLPTPLFPSPPRPRHSPASQHLPHPVPFSPSHFPTQKARRHHASGLTFPTFVPLRGLHFSAAGLPLTA